MHLSFWLVGLLMATYNPPALSRLTQSPAAKGAGWQYQQTAGPAGGTTYKASLNAANLLQLPYPYAGGSTVTLTLRSRNGEIHAYLSVSKGLFAPSFQGGRALIRFDAGKPITYSLSAAANGRANLVFFDDTSKLIRQIRASRTMVVQLQMPGQKLDEVRFNSVGLRWTH